MTSLGSRFLLPFMEKLFPPSLSHDGEKVSKNNNGDDADEDDIQVQKPDILWILINHAYPSIPVDEW